MKRLLRPAFLLPAAVVLVAGLLLAFGFLGKAVKAAWPSEGALVETIVATGRLITPARIEVGPVFTGTAKRVWVEEGGQVRAGQPLATLEDAERRAAVDQAARAEQEAAAWLVQLEQVARPVAEQALAQAEATLALAQKEFDRVQRLVANGFYNQAQLDTARRNFDSAKAACEASRAQAVGNRPDGVETRLALARQAQARAALDLARARLADTVVRAPGDGLVLRKTVDVGDVVTQGKVIFELAAAGETRVELLVDEKHLGHLALGQKAQVAADAYPGKPFAAELFYIAPGVDAQKGSVLVKLRVPEPPAFLRPDMTVSAEIEVGRRARALILPSQAVRDAASVAPWLLVVEAGRAQRRSIRLGLRGTGQVEVVEGLKPGEAVIPPTADVREGQRVRVE